MELNLSRVDYLHVGSSFSNCLKVLPSFNDDGSQQKMAVANREGILQVISWKQIEPISHTKVNLHATISAIQLGGAVARDKVFVATGNIVKGFTKKGKLFLEFDTNLAESINSMFVYGGHLLVCGKNVYSQFEDCQDTGYYVSDDEIIYVTALLIEKGKSLTPILACKDRTLRVLQRAKLKYLINLEGIPSVITPVFGDGGEAANGIIFGTTDGKFGLLTIAKDDGYLKWTFQTELNAGITCMDFFDLTADGNKELIIGFDDGTVQSCNESVTGVQGGIFGSEGFEEILIVTYSGWVIGLTTETSDKKIRVDDGSFSISDETRQKLVKLKGEIEEMTTKVAQEREKYQFAAEASSAGLSAIPYFAINDKMVLSKDDASYLLTLEVESPIDTILIQSDVPVDLLDVEKNSAVVSFSHCDPESGNFLLVTFRCQANTTRIEVRLRTIEGQHGSIQAYITPRIQPKCCQIRAFTIKPLSLHVRTHSFDPNRPYNTLTLKGGFSVTEIHSWLVSCIPEMPERAPSTGEASLTFVSSFLDTLLNCMYKQGEAHFKSDNISTISILKDCLTKEAIKKKLRLEIEFDFNEESVVHTLQLIRPKLEGFLALSKQVALIDSLKEIEAHDPEVVQVLSSEYKYILDNSDKLRASHKRQPSYLDRLYGMITDLYIDKHKYNGVNVKSRVPVLMEVLDRQDFELLVDFFQAPLNQSVKEY